MQGLTEASNEAPATNSETDSPAAAPAPSAVEVPAVAPTGAEVVVAETAVAETAAPGVVVAAASPAMAPSVVPPAPIVVARPPRPCRIDFEGCTGTEAARVEVRAWLDRLGDLTAALTNAEVAIESIIEPRKDRMYRVRMRLSMRAAVVVVAPDSPNNGPHEDIFCAIRNGFRAARRQLEAYAKEHPPVVDAGVTGGGEIR